MRFAALSTWQQSVGASHCGAHCHPHATHFDPPNADTAGLLAAWRTTAGHNGPTGRGWSRALARTSAQPVVVNHVVGRDLLAGEQHEPYGRSAQVHVARVAVALGQVLCNAPGRVYAARDRSRWQWRTCPILRQRMWRSTRTHHGRLRTHHAHVPTHTRKCTRARRSHPALKVLYSRTDRTVPHGCPIGCAVHSTMGSADGAGECGKADASVCGSRVRLCRGALWCVCV